MKLFPVAVSLLLSLLVDQCKSEVGSSCTQTIDCRNGLEFCGTDKTCRRFSCPDFYKYGPVDLTGYDGATEVSCGPYAGPHASTVGVDFRCRANAPPLAREDFNEICTATTQTLAGTQLFECLAYANDTDFTAFIETALALKTVASCDQGNLYYAYRTRVANSTSRFTTGNQNFDFDPNLPLSCIDTTLTAQSAPTTAPAPGDCATDNDCESPFAFCGTDRECHFYSCSEWYEYGRTGFTGNDGMTELSCTDLSGTVQTETGASYRCSDSTNPSPIRAAFDRNCTAQTGTNYFECWEYSENYDFSTFLADAGASNLVCQDSNESPRYYTNLIARKGEAPGPAIVAFSASTAFNETLAKLTLQSIVTITSSSFAEETSDPPTTTPATDPPSTPSPGTTDPPSTPAPGATDPPATGSPTTPPSAASNNLLLSVATATVALIVASVFIV